VILNGVAQNEPHARPTTHANHTDFLDEFPSVPPDPEPGNFVTEAWTVDIGNHIENGDLVVPEGKYFMMAITGMTVRIPASGFRAQGKHHWPPTVQLLVVRTPDEEENKTGLGDRIAWMGHVALHFFSDTRWSRTLHLTR